MAWFNKQTSFNASPADPVKASKAVPPANPYAFTVPSYLRGSPYSKEAVPTYADNQYQKNGPHDYQSLTWQQKWWPFGSRPSSDSPPAHWIGYYQDNFARSITDEHVLHADEGLPLYQRNWIPRLNPYWSANTVNRPQRTVSDYNFLRNPGRNYLGRRDLTGEHYSAANTVTDQQAVALKGMSVNMHRRSTFRLEPVQYGENTVSVVADSGFSPAQATYVSPTSPSYTRSFRLS